MFFFLSVLLSAVLMPAIHFLAFSVTLTKLEGLFYISCIYETKSKMLL